jgi:hypothetical protein
VPGGVKHLPVDAAYRALLNSRRRHYGRFAADQQGPKMRLFAPKLLKTYEAECGRKRAFIEETRELERRLDRTVEAIRLIAGDSGLCALLASEGLAAMPDPLARRVQGKISGLTSPLPTAQGRALVNGISPDVLDLFKDSAMWAKLFGLLRQVLPARQMEIARLMIAMERVRFNYAKMLVALTPRSLLVNDIDPRKEIEGLSEEQLAVMEPELDRLSHAFLSAVERRGLAGLELVAASCYFCRLMDNPRVVRYLAHNFPGRFEEFHRLATPASE